MGSVSFAIKGASKPICERDCALGNESTDWIVPKVPMNWRHEQACFEKRNYTIGKQLVLLRQNTIWGIVMVSEITSRDRKGVSRA